MPGVSLFGKLFALAFGSGSVFWLCHAGLALFHGSPPTPVDPRCEDGDSSPYTFLCDQARKEGYGIAVYQGHTVFFHPRRNGYDLAKPIKIGSIWTEQMIEELPINQLPPDFRIVEPPRPR